MTLQSRAEFKACKFFSETILGKFHSVGEGNRRCLMIDCTYSIQLRDLGAAETELGRYSHKVVEFSLENLRTVLTHSLPRIKVNTRIFFAYILKVPVMIMQCKSMMKYLLQ